MLHKSGCGRSGFNSDVMAGSDGPVQPGGLVADRDVSEARLAGPGLHYVVHVSVGPDVCLEEIGMVSDALVVGPLGGQLDASPV